MFQSGAMFLSFVGIIVFSTFFLHMILSKIFKIERDIAMITSIASIFGPAFVPILVKKLKNPDVLLPGIASGLFGYAIGNYLGIGLFYFLDWMM